MSSQAPTKKPLRLLMPRLMLINFLGLLGCADNIREASSLQIKQLISQTGSDQQQIWTAPELQHRQFRLSFYGYDTVDYRLTAQKDLTDNQKIIYQLLIDANFGTLQGAKIRHYDQARLANGSILLSEKHRFETGRCQFFSTMNFACLYRDRTAITISPELLTTARQTGISLTLGSNDKDYEQIDLPANYIEGLLQAIQIP